jgi:hypothetical protein
MCTFGALCRNDHPSDADCAALLAEFASKPWPAITTVI